MMRPFVLLASLLLAPFGCAEISAPDANSEEPTPSGVGITLNLAGAPEITQVRVEVTAPDLAAPITAGLPIVDGVARGTVRVPAGPQRTFLLQALDQLDIVRYEGSATVDVVQGVNPTLTIVLEPKDPSGEVPIEGVIGTYSITLSVTQATLEVGADLFLVATVRDPLGAIVENPSIWWHSLNSEVGGVDGGGRVVAYAPGELTVWAKYEDHLAVATITVVPASP